VNRKLLEPRSLRLKESTRSPSAERAFKRRIPNAVPAMTAFGDTGREAARAAQQASVQVRKRTPPPMETNAELFYYKKQIDAHTPMVIVLLDGEEIEGTIEWYDRGA